MNAQITVVALLTSILLFGIPLTWFILSSIFLKGSCPKCGWGQIRPSMPHSSLDWLLRLFSIGAFRCRVCRTRFYRFRLRHANVAPIESNEAIARIVAKPAMNRPRPIAETPQRTKVQFEKPVLQTASAGEPSTFQNHSQWQRSESTISPMTLSSDADGISKAAVDA